MVIPNLRPEDEGMNHENGIMLINFIADFWDLKEQYALLPNSTQEQEVEIVMNELRKNQNFHFDLQIHPTLLNSTYLHCQMTGFISIRVQKI